jgi:hypothetical protein
MRELLLHVGHYKTGSSYIQSALACSVSDLSDIGIYYPANKKILRASEGRISSGNGEILTSDFGSYVDAAKGASTILLSSEKLFLWFPDDEFQTALAKFVDAFQISKIKILLYIREPVEHISSSYQQAIKRGGYTESLNVFCEQYSHVYKVHEFIAHCAEVQRYDVKILNYSFCSENLIESFEKWLGIPIGFLTTPPIARINRSLTFGELEFQRIANVFFGKKASFLADKLCESLPDIKSDVIYLSLAEQKMLLDKLSPYCCDINDYAESLENYSDKYKLTLIENTEPVQHFSFSKEQVRVIAESFSGFIDNISR